MLHAVETLRCVTETLGTKLKIDPEPNTRFCGEFSDSLWNGKENLFQLSFLDIFTFDKGELNKSFDQLDIIPFIDEGDLRSLRTEVDFIVQSEIISLVIDVAFSIVPSIL